MAATIAIFLGWVWVFSDLPSFVQSVLMVAGEMGRSRMTVKTTVKALSFNTFPLYIQYEIWERQAYRVPETRSTRKSDRR